MYLEDFPLCCTAKVVVNLGGSTSCEDGFVEYSDATFEAGLSKAVSSAKADGNAFVVATTTTEQEDAYHRLKEFGFLCAGPYKKSRHSETGLFLWWLPLEGMFDTEG